MASMTAANALKLTDAVPAQVVDEPLRPIQLGMAIRPCTWSSWLVKW